MTHMINLYWVKIKCLKLYQRKSFKNKNCNYVNIFQRTKKVFKKKKKIVIQ